MVPYIHSHAQYQSFVPEPDCNTGWDSHRVCYFNWDALPTMTPCLVVSIKEFERYYPDWRWKQVLLDVAHDALPIYRYFEFKGTLSFIDLNQRKTGNNKVKDGITVSPEGVPIAKKG